MQLFHLFTLALLAPVSFAATAYVTLWENEECGGDMASETYEMDTLYPETTCFDATGYGSVRYSGPDSPCIIWSSPGSSGERCGIRDVTEGCSVVVGSASDIGGCAAFMHPNGEWPTQISILGCSGSCWAGKRDVNATEDETESTLKPRVFEA